MSKSKLIFKKELNLRNRKAAFNYAFLRTYVAGIALKGTEIKSLRMGKVVLGEAFCLFIADALYVRNMHIAPYTMGTHNNHSPKRDRKLLLKKKELRQLQEKLKNQGLTIVPTKIFINSRGLAKLTIALAKGKKVYDKRQDLKAKDQAREMRNKF